MNRLRRRTATVTVSTLAVLVLTGNAAFAAHFIPNDSVDGGEIRYENETKYNDALSNRIAGWNALGSTDLKADSATSSADLQVQDRNNPGASWDGLYQPSSGADEIYLNVAFLDGYNTTQRRSVAAHELGHAYGLGDHGESTYSGILMYKCSTCSGKTAPTAHDKSDWGQKWN